MKLTSLLLLVLSGLLFFTCSTEHPKKIDLSTKTKTVLESDETLLQDTIWQVYAGKVGPYDQQIIIQFTIIHDSVIGEYYYSVHQEFLQLNGGLNKSNDSIYIQERHLGKSTGYWQIKLLNNSVDGIWRKIQNSSDQEIVTARKLFDSKKHISLSDHRFYNRPHVISFYNGENIPSDTFEVTDLCYISLISDSLLSFSHHVSAVNGHQGSIEGIAKMKSKHKATYTDTTGCELDFRFSNDSLTIEETDCMYYRGFRANFDSKMKRSF